MRAPRLPQEEDFDHRLRGPWLTTRVWRWLGICFAVALVTGLVSHWAYLPDPAVPFPTRPVWGYRLTQGLHVAAGTAAVPLLLVKLWSVYPRLFARPPLGPWRPLVGHLLERGSIAALVASAIFLVSSGVANVAHWYPWAFSFRSTHGAVAWIAGGALLVHLAVKLPVIRAALAAPVSEGDPAEQEPSTAGAMSRRGLLRATGAAAAVAVLATVGSTVPLLRRISVLGVRSGEGPQGVPINKSAVAAGVVALASDPAYRLTVVFGASERSWSRDELAALPQRSADLPIACVEGWSASGVWSGVPLRHLLDLVGAPRGAAVRVESLQPSGPFRASTLPGQFADDPLTLVALGLAGEELALDHGYPARLIAPDRPGVLQTKWVSRIEVLS